MFRGMYTVTSAMQTNQKKLDVATNNISNADTKSYKKDVIISEAFPEKLMSKINNRYKVDRSSIKEKVEVTDDGDGMYLKSRAGFFTVKNPMGTSYSREVKFSVDEEGYLKTYTRDINRSVDTSTGFYLTDRNGQRVQVQDGNFQVNDKGQLIENGNIVAELLTNASPNVIGTINSGLRVDRIQTNFLQGNLEQTSRPLDFAIRGNGFFRVLTDEGMRFTRDGSFSINDKGELVTSEGHLVMGINSDEPGTDWKADMDNINRDGIQPVQVGIFDEFDGTVKGGQDIEVQENGDIFLNGEYVDTIDIVNVLNVNALRKEGEGRYKVEEGTQIETADFDGKLVTGFVEGSNVARIDEMIEMVNIMRNFDTSQRVVKAYDEMLGKAVNEIGKV